MNNKHAWSTLQLLIILAIAVSPFWGMATNWSDMSEAKATGFGLTLAGVVGACIKGWHGMRGGE